jgi:hypothetical protein
VASPANLRINIFADTKKLKKGLDDAKNKTKTFSLKSIASFAAIGTAATLAFDVVKDAINGAIEEQDQVDKLNGALGRLAGGLVINKDAVNDWVTALGLATDQTDDSLRPALTRLLDATGDLTTAQSLLMISTDLATASGKPLETVVNAVAKAQNGNKTALIKLFPELSKVNDKTKTGADLVKYLGDKYKGTSSEATKTAKGGLATLDEAFDNVKETLGGALLPYLSTFAAYLQSPEGQKALSDFMEKLENIATSIGNAADDVDEFKRRMEDLGDWAKRNEKWLNLLAFITNPIYATGLNIGGTRDSLNNAFDNYGGSYGGIYPNSAMRPSTVINIQTIDPAAAGVAVRRALNTDTTRRGNLRIGG